MMTDFKKQGADFELEKIFEGMKAAAAGKELGMSDEEKNAMLTAFGKLVQKKQVEKLKKEAADNLAAGEAYMAKNASNPNVKKLESGVQLPEQVPSRLRKTWSKLTITVRSLMVLFSIQA